MENTNAFNEMMVHLPLCTHKEASNVLIIGTCDEEFKEQAKKHEKTSNFEYADVSLLASKNEKNIDAIIFTNPQVDELLLANIERVLKDDGLICFPSKTFFEDKQKLKDDLTQVGNKFWIAMPFNFGNNTSIIASKKYHPTADLNLQRADLLDDLKYYSAEIHNSSFVFPASEHRALTGIAKR